MNKKNSVVFVAFIAMISTLYHIVIIGNHYIMPVYYVIYGGTSEVYPHYFETWETIALAIMVGIIAGIASLGITKISSRFKFQQRKERNSGSSGIPL